MTAFFSPDAVRLETWFPKALLYREWRLNRGKYALAAALWMAEFIGQWWFAARLPLPAQQYERTVLRGYALSNLSNAAIAMEVLIAVSLGVLVMRQDAASGNLAYTLAGPVKRRDVLRVKAGFALTALVLAQGVNWLVLSSAYTGLTGQDEFGRIGVAVLAHTVVLAALVLTALAAACTTSNVIFAAAGALLAAAVPMFVRNLIRFVHGTLFTGVAAGTPDPHWLQLTMVLVGQLSPLAGYHFTTAWFAGLYFLWFVAWAAAFWVTAQRVFEAAPAERFSNVFYFPWLWYVVLGGVSFIIATIFAHVLTDLRNGYMFLLWFVLFFGASWWTIKTVMQRTEGTKTNGA